MVVCYLYVDLPLTTFLYQSDKYYPWIAYTFTQINHLGTGMVYIIGASLIFLWAVFIAKNKRAAWISGYFLASLTLAGLVCNLLKIIAGRARPFEFFTHNLYGFYFWQYDNNFWSFPSGHATTIAVLTTATYLLLRRFGALLFLLFILVFAGRVISRAHYLSDVMGGAYLGFMISYWLYRLLNKIDAAKISATL